MLRNAVLASFLLSAFATTVQAQPCTGDNSCWTISNESKTPITITCTNPVDNFVVPILEPGQSINRQYDSSYGDGLGLWPVEGMCRMHAVGSDKVLRTDFNTTWWGSSLLAKYTATNELQVTVKQYWKDRAEAVFPKDGVSGEGNSP